MKRRTTKILDYVGLVIIFLRKSRMGGLERGIRVSLFEASKSVVAR